MLITTDHPASSNGLPVILDDEGNLLIYDEGLRRARSMLGWSQTRLASESGVSLGSIRSYERSTRIPGNATLYTLMKALNDQ